MPTRPKRRNAAPKPSVSDEARWLRARRPEWTESEIARELGCHRRTVHAALRRSAVKGRPPATHKRITLVVPQPLLEYARSRCDREGYDGLADVLLAAAEAELVPAADWLAYCEARGEAEKPRKRAGSGGADEKSTGRPSKSVD